MGPGWLRFPFLKRSKKGSLEKKADPYGCFTKKRVPLFLFIGLRGGTINGCCHLHGLGVDLCSTRFDADSGGKGGAGGFKGTPNL